MELTEGSRALTTTAGHATGTEATRDRTGRPSVKQVIITWAAKDKYTEIKHLKGNKHIPCKTL